MRRVIQLRGFCQFCQWGPKGYAEICLAAEPGLQAIESRGHLRRGLTLGVDVIDHAWAADRADHVLGREPAGVDQRLDRQLRLGLGREP